MNEKIKSQGLPMIRVFLIFLVLSFAACVMVMFRPVISSDYQYLFLIWNLFLAWVPFVLSIGVYLVSCFAKQSKGRDTFLLIGGIIWLAFYPNAPYLVTDFIHLSGKSFVSYGSVGFPVVEWYDLVLFSLFIFAGFLIGFLSLYIMQRILRSRYNRGVGWFFAAGVLFVSSFGIYLGRFIRWNTWDILFRPTELLRGIAESFHRYAAAFTLLYGLFLLLIYLAFYTIAELNLSANPTAKKTASPTTTRAAKDSALTEEKQSAINN